MRVSFLCSSFEPGRDGVGDYVQQFARFLGRRGHAIQVIALADRFVSSPATHADDAKPFELVRIPAQAWLRRDISRAEAALASFRPDWLSLQMVCYGYGRSGLLIGAERVFARLARFGQRHIMFHELWIGEAGLYALKERVIGAAQKWLLLRLTRSWAPAIAHTSNPLYQELLRRNGIEAEVLALPGNIPIVAIDRVSARQRLCAVLGCEAGSDAGTFIAGIFGALHPHWARCARLGDLADICRGLGKKLVVVHFGCAGPQGAVIWEDLARQWAGAMEFARLGELPPERISQTLQGLDLGIATSPWPLVGKSGTVAALLEHGVPTVVAFTSYSLRRGPTPEPTPHGLLHKLDDNFAGKLASGAIRTATPRAHAEAFVEFTAALAGNRHRP